MCSSLSTTITSVRALHFPSAGTHFRGHPGHGAACVLIPQHWLQGVGGIKSQILLSEDRNTHFMLSFKY